jgi:hypothetical protein
MEPEMLQPTKIPFYLKKPENLYPQIPIRLEKGIGKIVNLKN